MLHNKIRKIKWVYFSQNRENSHCKLFSVCALFGLRFPYKTASISIAVSAVWNLIGKEIHLLVNDIKILLRLQFVWLTPVTTPSGLSNIIFHTTSLDGRISKPSKTMLYWIQNRSLQSQSFIFFSCLHSKLKMCKVIISRF